MNTVFGRIGVLAGGVSSEREISLRSGRAVVEALLKKGLNAEFIDMDGDPERRLRGANIDIAFIALHGAMGEDGSVQRLLESLKIPYTGSGPRSSWLALDKVATRKIFAKKNIPFPEYFTVARGDRPGQAGRLGYPVVVKPSSEGSSIGLSIVKNAWDLGGAVSLAHQYSDIAIVERFINGRELTVAIFDGHALPVIEIIARNNIYNYKAKYDYKSTRYVIPADIDVNLTKRVKAYAVKAHRALGLRDFSRVDIRLDEDGNIFILEANTIPGLTRRSLLPKAALAAGIKFDELCVKLLELACRRMPIKKEVSR